MPHSQAQNTCYNKHYDTLETRASRGFQRYNDLSLTALAFNLLSNTSRSQNTVNSKSRVSNVVNFCSLTYFTGLMIFSPNEAIGNRSTGLLEAGEGQTAPFLYTSKKLNVCVFLTPVRYNGGQLYIRSQKVPLKPLIFIK